MKFCNTCDSLLQTLPQSKQILLSCKNCGSYIEGEPADSLLYEETNSTNTSGTDMFDVFIENSPNDKSAYRVSIKCEKCKLPYMSFVRVGDHETSKLICKCGAIYDYNKKNEFRH